MASITLREVVRQTQELVSDSEGRFCGGFDLSKADAIECLLGGIVLSAVDRRAGVWLYEGGESRQDYRTSIGGRKVQTSYKTITVCILMI